VPSPELTPPTRPDGPVQRSSGGLGASSLLRIKGYSVAWVVPLVLLVGLLLFDLNTSGRFRVISWVVMVPGISAALCGVWTTAAFAVLAVLAYINMEDTWPQVYETGLPDFVLVTAGGAIAVAVSWVRIRNERRALHMRDVVETTLRTVLRPLPPRWGGLDHAAVYLAADSVAKIGGDFYDIQPSPHGTRVLLGDVQGKGLGAVDGAAVLLSSFRESGYYEPELSTVAERLEARMMRHRFYCMQVGRDDSDRFATALLLGFPPPDRPGRPVAFINFGHQPPLVVGPSGVHELPAGDGLPLGLGDLHDGRVPVQQVVLGPEETLLLVTDGVTEARDAHGVFFPLAAAVAQALADDPTTARPDRLVAFVRDATLRHGGGHLADDTTIFAVRAPTTTLPFDHRSPDAPPDQEAS
jgi:hypothetical protein